jgi:hypothetical protein
MCFDKIYSIYIKTKRESFNYKNIILHIFALIAIIVGSCQKNMNIEIKTNDNRLLVAGEFTNDSIIHVIKLFCSGSLTTGKPQTTISGAKIYVTDKIDTFNYIENTSTPGIYQTPNMCRGIGGHTYYLTISNIDVDKDGIMETYSAKGIMPVPVILDSMKSTRDTLINGDPGGSPAIFNYIYYKILFNGPDDIYMQINNKGEYEINDWQVDNSVGAYMSSVSEINNQDSIKKLNVLIYLFTTYNAVAKGDTLICNCMNLTKNDFTFLIQLSKNNSSSTNGFKNNFYDQLNIPVNLLTNIESNNKVAGYFFIYSVSKISKILNE